MYEKARSPIVSSCEGWASSSWKVTWVSGWPAKAESSMARTLAGIHTLVRLTPLKAFVAISVTPSGMRTSVAVPVYDTSTPSASMVNPSALACSGAAALTRPNAPASAANAAGTLTTVRDRVPASANASTVDFRWDIYDPLY